jgi:predicted aspartyl protease
MSPHVGTFRTDVQLENPLAPEERQLVRDALVDTGAALSWFPKDVLQTLNVRSIKQWRFRQADGTILERWTAEVRLRVGATATIDEVVIGEPGDLVLLGARSLEGLNLRVDPVAMRLVDAGPAPAAVAA